jgi:2-oxo-4-hydroxy-4-carboxy--5-ureidoimidazoline (OHCU) decarboxylase
MEGFGVRRRNTVEQEIATALGEVRKIALHRLSDLIDPSPSSSAKL